MKRKKKTPISDLFGYVCHCTDPRATHERPGLDGVWGACFVSSCGCSKFKLNNLLYLEQMSDEADS